MTFLSFWHGNFEQKTRLGLKFLGKINKKPRQIDGVLNLKLMSLFSGSKRCFQVLAVHAGNVFQAYTFWAFYLASSGVGTTSMWNLCGESPPGCRKSN